MLNKTFGDSCLSETQAYEWYKEFKAGREIVEDLPRSGRPSTSTTADNIDNIKTLVLENRHMSVRELGQERDISTMSAHIILSDILDMKRVAARLVPKELNVLQKEHWKQAAFGLLDETDTTSAPTETEKILQNFPNYATVDEALVTSNT
ncbi:hypothetical protein NQ318_010112 [Aromia moschata]|uniref:Mos1 transposase HTH domain-containing protein n=1 Tax=Aromia moschata TaxID=1265417 RepID=A0AAV8Y8Z1_9CUCU|nr:hypothetical protein NQ318_010112 [Aromia moschata]